VAGGVNWMLEGPVLLTGMFLGAAAIVLIAVVGGWLTMSPKAPVPIVAQVIDEKSAEPETEPPTTAPVPAPRKKSIRAALEATIGIRGATVAQLRGMPVTYTGEIAEIREDNEGEWWVELRSEKVKEEALLVMQPDQESIARRHRVGDVVRAEGRLRNITLRIVVIDGTLGSPQDAG